MRTARSSLIVFAHLPSSRCGYNSFEGQQYLQIDDVRIFTCLYCICSVPIIKTKLLRHKIVLEQWNFPRNAKEVRSEVWH